MMWLPVGMYIVMVLATILCFVLSGWQGWLCAATSVLAFVTLSYLGHDSGMSLLIVVIACVVIKNRKRLRI